MMTPALAPIASSARRTAPATERLSPAVESVVAEVLEQARVLLGVSTSCLVLDTANGELVTRQVSGSHEGWRIGPVQGAAREAVDGGAAVVSRRGRFARATQTAEPSDVARSFAAVPLAGGPHRGAIWVGTPEPSHGFSEHDLDALRALARVTARALETQAPPHDDERAGAALDAFQAMLELRDGYAADDAASMVELADDVARRLELDEASRRDLNWAARLHDIGKIGVPDRILHKPGKLDPDERIVLQRHVVWGAQAVARVPGWARVAEIIAAHHERWDGRGYPAGLHGEAIPVESRIVGMCEAFRALTSERPYRPGIEPGRALAVVARAAGAHFDPATVSALSAALAAQGITAPEAAVERRPSPPASPQAVASGFGRRLPAALARVERLPALVESRDRLIELLRSERPADGEIVRAVESDIALVVAVLRMANSGAGRRRKIGSVPEAVRAVSPHGVEMLASRMSVVDLLRARSSGAAAQRLRVHALAVQRAADRLAAALATAARDELLVAALLHDIGTLVLDDACDGYPHRLHKTARTPEERARAERLELGMDHAALGGVLLRRWGFPDRLAEAVEQHHAARPEGAAAMVQLADQLARYNEGQPVDSNQVLRTAQGLGLGADALREVMYDLAVGGQDKPRPLDACPLTSHELAAVRGLAEGKLYKDIAAELGVATSTVRSHLHKAYRRLGVADRAQAVLICARKGWL